MKAGLIVAALVLAAPFAHAQTCSGEDIRFDVNGTQITNVVTDDSQVAADIASANNGEVYSTSLSGDPAGYDSLVERSFESPSPIGTGTIKLYRNSVTGQAELQWDNADGGILTYDVICK